MEKKQVPIKRTEFVYDLDWIREDLNWILKRYPFNSEGQIGLNWTGDSTSTTSQPYQATGDLRMSNCPSYNLAEENFVYFIEEFKGTIFFKIWSDLKGHGWKLGRARLAKLSPKKTMWMHRDENLTRLHLAVQTNPHCFILYEKLGYKHIPADGHIYHMDADPWHTAVNSGREDRIHLLISKSSQQPCNA